MTKVRSVYIIIYLVFGVFHEPKQRGPGGGVYRKKMGTLSFSEIEKRGLISVGIGSWNQSSLDFSALH